MKKSLRDAWVARLRNPASKQFHKRAYDVFTPSEATTDTAMCCIAHLAFVSDFVPKNETDVYDYLSNVSGMKGSPFTINGMKEHDVVAVLITKNDEENKTLPEIADWIEANIPITEE